MAMLSVILVQKKPFFTIFHPQLVSIIETVDFFRVAGVKYCKQRLFKIIHEIFEKFGTWPNNKRAGVFQQKKETRCSNSWGLMTRLEGVIINIPTPGTHSIITLSSLKAVDSMWDHSLIFTFCYKKELPVLEKFLRWSFTICLLINFTRLRHLALRSATKKINVDQDLTYYSTFDKLTLFHVKYW